MPWFLPEVVCQSIPPAYFGSGFQPSGSWWAATQPDGLGWYGKGLCPSRNEHSIRGFEEQQPVYADLDGRKMRGLRGGSFTSSSSGDGVSPLLDHDALVRKDDSFSAARFLRPWSGYHRRLHHERRTDPKRKNREPYWTPGLLVMVLFQYFSGRARRSQDAGGASSSTSTLRKPLSGKFTDESRRNDISS